MMMLREPLTTLPLAALAFSLSVALAAHHTVPDLTSVQTAIAQSSSSETKAAEGLRTYDLTGETNIAVARACMECHQPALTRGDHSCSGGQIGALHALQGHDGYNACNTLSKEDHASLLAFANSL